MRKSGLCLSGLYMECAGEYGHYVEWREKSIGRKRKSIAAFVLAAVLGIVAVNPMAVRMNQAKAVVSQTSGTALAGGVSEEPLRLVSRDSEPKISGVPMGTLIKETGDILVVLDPGHGGEDEGCSSEGVEEKALNLQIALRVQSRLLEMGYQVRLTRETDIVRTLEERVQAANQAGADIYVSIHQNASEEKDVEGIEVWYSGQNEGAESERLSRVIQKYVVESTGARARELQENEELFVIRECTMPACLIETGFLSNRAERGKLAGSGYQEQLAEGIARGIDVYFHPRTMYLTFDDGPSDANTNRILDILKARGIHAAFFLIGENVEKHPETAKRIAAEGHTIGIHCYRHDYEALYDSVESYIADFEKAQAVVRDVTGVETKLFRFPGGSINGWNKQVHDQIAEEMAKRGCIYYDWNASLEDAVSNPKAEKLIANGVSSTLGRKKVIMLAHDVIGETGLCLEELLDQLPEYEMELLTEDVEPIQF